MFYASVLIHFLQDNRQSLHNNPMTTYYNYVTDCVYATKMFKTNLPTRTSKIILNELNHFGTYTTNKIIISYHSLRMNCCGLLTI